MTELQTNTRTKECREEVEVILDERFRKRMVSNIRRNRKILEKLAKL